MRDTPALLMTLQVDADEVDQGNEKAVSSSSSLQSMWSQLSCMMTGFVQQPCRSTTRKLADRHLPVATYPSQPGWNDVCEYDVPLWFNYGNQGTET